MSDGALDTNNRVVEAGEDEDAHDDLVRDLDKYVGKDKGLP